MKIKKAPKIMALALAVAVIVAFLPAMVSAATINPTTGIGTIGGVINTVANTVTFTVPYTMTATGTDEVTLLVTKGSDVVTYADPPANTQPNNITYIDQVTYVAPVAGGTASFTFVADVPAATATYYVKVGGTGIDTPASATKVITLTPTGFTVSGYVAVVGSTATIVGTSYSAIADADGLFSIATVPTGTYDLAISKKGALTRTIPIGTLSADYVVSLATNKIPLFIGDGNGDGLVNNLDLAGVKGVFGKVDGGTGYNALYDVNNDNIINNLDLALVKGSFGKVTSSYITWAK